MNILSRSNFAGYNLSFLKVSPIIVTFDIMFMKRDVKLVCSENITPELSVIAVLVSLIEV